MRDGRRGFADFLKEGLVEYLDVNEENNSYIALYESEITRTRIWRLSRSRSRRVCGDHPVPAPQSVAEHVPVRDGKQAMGNIAFNQLNRMDTLTYLLVYPQRPIVKTKTIELIGYDRLGAGQNATVAVMSYSGYDIEDAIVMNRAALDRGFGGALRKYGAQIKKYSNRTTDRIVPPSEEQRNSLAKNGRHRLLDGDGIAVGERIRPGDVYVNKQSPSTPATRCLIRRRCRIRFRPTPQSYKGPQGEACVVDKVMLTMTDEGQFNVSAWCGTRGGRRWGTSSRRATARRACAASFEQATFRFRAGRDPRPDHEPARVPA